MGKILAIDFGTKRIGYAVSDDEQTMAFPRSSLAKVPEKKLFEELRELVRAEGISKIIIGLPLDEENRDTHLAKKVKKMGEKLARMFILPIEYIDEFGSSQEALSKIPFRKDRRKKGYADAVAAQIILQRYLERQSQ